MYASQKRWSICLDSGSYRGSGTDFLKALMADFTQARTNMVDGQIHTNGVVSAAVLEAFQSIPREVFLPEDIQGMAYTDEDVPVGGGRFMMEPAVHARMLQEAAPGKEDVVLDIGCGTGYSSAILSPMVTTVVALEQDKKALEKAGRLWDGLDVRNIVGVHGKLTAGNPENEPFSLIIMNGAVSEIPENIVSQLTPEGRLITILRKPGEVMGRVTMVQNLGEGQFSSYNLFSAGCPYLPGFESAPQFNF